MKSVYNLVETLDFIDNPEIFIPPNNTFGVKDIKSFVAKLIEK